MTENEKILFTKECIEKLANGINPFDDSTIPESDIVNNIRVSRCLFYVSSLLDRLLSYEAGFIVNAHVTPQPKEPKKKKTYEVSDTALTEFPYVEGGLLVSQIIEFLSVEMPDTAKKLSTEIISKHMLQKGYIKDIEGHDGRVRKVPTRLGEEMDIKTENRVGPNGAYFVMLYGVKAQKYIVENFRTMLEEKIARDAEEAERAKTWTEKDDTALVDCFHSGYTVAQISKQLNKPVKEIRSRLVALGLILKNSDAV